MARRVLCVASTGGHLEQLFKLSDSLLMDDQNRSWVTFDSPQSRSLLADEPDVHYVRRVEPRGYSALFRNLIPALRVLRKLRPQVVYSTGAGIALAYLPLARLFGARAVYIESAARTNGPSLTGRLLRLLPWIELRTQYRSWADERWQFAGSVFDGYVAVAARGPQRPIRRALVTLGTQAGYPFVSLVRRIQEIVPDDVEVRWQVGEGFPHEALPDGAREMISRDELEDWIATSDVVVAHAGVGSALTLLDSRCTPVLVPRSASRGEHVDEHQQLIAEELAMRGLAVAIAPDELEWNHLVRATRTRTKRVSFRQPAAQVSRTETFAIRAAG